MAVSLTNQRFLYSTRDRQLNTLTCAMLTWISRKRVSRGHCIKYLAYLHAGTEFYYIGLLTVVAVFATALFEVPFNGRRVG